jgi:hypothetical protein
VVNSLPSRQAEPLRLATRLHAFLAKWYAAVMAAANRRTTAIQIQNTGVELSIVNSPSDLARAIWLAQRAP